jgi:hypothetical protein
MLNVWDEEVYTNMTGAAAAHYTCNPEMPDSNQGLKSAYPKRLLGAFADSREKRP